MSQVARNLENRYHATVPAGIVFEPQHHVNGFMFPLMPVLASFPKPQLHFFRWGLIPSWTHGRDQAEKMRAMTLNARSESAFEKPSFRKAMVSQRCLIPADGFYEWQESGTRKIPWFIRLKNTDIFSFGGIWEKWLDENSEPVFTFSILTTEANSMMAEIHNTKKRMPLILLPEDEALWLDHSVSREELQKKMVPYPESGMEGWTISRLITARGTDTNTPEVKRPFAWPSVQSTRC